ncbi:uncharacterized protein Z520_11360 [Fonsecaea multimorphosa CBS 102226]|uniref:Uncharacterized protein n=1 Tax=Fonsecaea multimorphosa CBS 102226 TaxID=1442371 RepID=A0A0D2JQZ4_9EURO|nr:uncharacterized protein Z520_11360 [Fonsecaea multimorphosa CBS 102226]KIX92884.1 hypothetical protein Z520_11360 [Fonsecaea multimorphosa CBS 102226]
MNFSLPDIPGLLEPYLPPALQAYLTRQNLQTLLRVIVALSTYILFRPHLESLFRKMTGTPDRREEEARARMEFLRRQQQQQQQQPQTGGQGGNRSMGIVGKDGKVYQVVSPAQQQQGAGGKNAKGGKKKDGRRKA